MKHFKTSDVDPNSPAMPVRQSHSQPQGMAFKEALKLHRGNVEYLCWTEVVEKFGKSQKIVHHFIHEKDETIGVHSRRLNDLRDLLLNWYPQYVSGSLVQVASVRGMEVWAPVQDKEVKRTATDIRQLMVELTTDDKVKAPLRGGRGPKIQRLAVESTLA